MSEKPRFRRQKMSDDEVLRQHRVVAGLGASNTNPAYEYKTRHYEGVNEHLRFAFDDECVGGWSVAWVDRAFNSAFVVFRRERTT